MSDSNDGITKLLHSLEETAANIGICANAKN